MRAVGLMKHGGPEVLDVVDVPEAHAGPGQVRIKVFAAAVNPTDTMARNGSRAEQQKADPPPYIPGMDAAGIVDEVSEDVETGVKVGDRVALMIPPGVDLAIALYGCWRMGAVPVLIDGGLGPAQMSAAMKVADPDHLIGIRRALAAARTLRWPGRRIAVEPTNRVARRLLGVEHDLPSLQDAPSVTLPVVDPDAEAAVVFTSGATGPSKGVRYSAARIDAQIRTLVEQYDISADDSLVAAFAPFALYGPAMGLPSTVPDMDVSSPGTLTAATLLDAAEAVDASLVFASPAAILSVLETLDELGDRRTDPVDAIERALTRAPTDIARLCDHDHHLGPGGPDTDGSRPTDAVEHVDRPFDRGRRNRTGRRADHVAGTATDPEAAIGVDRPDIAGGVPAVGGRGEVGRVPQTVVAKPLMGGP